MADEKKYIEYKGRPLVRNGNIFCYGNPKDKAVLILIVLTTKTVNDKEIPDVVLLQVQSTGADKAILKQSEKRGLYEALDYGISWLDRELKK